MEDLSLHILDIAENSIRAGAKSIFIVIEENTKKNILHLQIKDNGKGMNSKERRHASDPFYSTSKVKRIGLGLSMLAQSAHEADGTFSIRSQKNKGTTVTATFVHGHIDRKPLGNMASTIVALVASKPDIICKYTHVTNGRTFLFDTREFKKRIRGFQMNDAKALILLQKHIEEGLQKLAKRSKDEKIEDR